MPAAHITTVSLPAERCTAPITCMSVGSALDAPSGGAVTLSASLNQAAFTFAGGALAFHLPSAADNSSSPTRASATSGMAPCFVAS